MINTEEDTYELALRLVNRFIKRNPLIPIDRFQKLKIIRMLIEYKEKLLLDK